MPLAGRRGSLFFALCTLHIRPYFSLIIMGVNCILRGPPYKRMGPREKKTLFSSKLPFLRKGGVGWLQKGSRRRRGARNDLRFFMSECTPPPPPLDSRWNEGGAEVFRKLFRKCQQCAVRWREQPPPAKRQRGQIMTPEVFVAYASV